MEYTAFPAGNDNALRKIPLPERTSLGLHGDDRLSMLTFFPAPFLPEHL